MCFIQQSFHGITNALFYLEIIPEIDMTLSIAWKEKKKILLASDSRISKFKNVSDYGVKVTPVPIKVYDAREAGKDLECLLNTTYGMCFAGDFAAESILGNFTSIILQRLQFASLVGNELSFAVICEFVFRIYEKISNQLQDEIDQDGIDFLFTGFCPKDQKFYLAKFSIDYGQELDQFDPRVEIVDDSILGAGNVVSIGSGGDNFDRRHCPELSPLRTLKMVINDTTEPSVGGNIQVGMFDDQNNFYTTGIMRFTNGDEKYQYHIAGLDMNEDLFVGSDGLIFMGTYLDEAKM